MKRIVIVGAGFAGLRAARRLQGKGFEIVMVDRQNYHLFQPLLYQVATASLEQESIVHPVRAIIRKWDDVTFRMAEVESIDPTRHRLLTDNGKIDYDYLIMAAGAATNFFGQASIAEHAVELKTLADAVDLRNRVLRAFERAVSADEEERRALLTFVVVGGGPTGVEFAGALAELVNNVLSKDYPELPVDDTRIVLVEAQDGLLPPYSNELRTYTKDRLEELGVEVRLDTQVVDAGPERVTLEDGSVIQTHMLLWMAGVQAAPIAETLPGEKARSGRVPVTDNLTLPGWSNVYVVGDMSYVEQNEAPLPQMAPVAMQMGEYVARHIVAREAGESITPFRYKDKGSMAVIGRGHAVAQVFGVKLAGVLAWLAWLMLHLAMLIDFRNRLVVLINWAYDYMLYDRKVRVITGGEMSEIWRQTRDEWVEDENYGYAVSETGHQTLYENLGAE